MIIRNLAIVALAALLFAPTADAKQRYVELDAKAELEVEVVDEDGEKTVKRVPAVKVMPGEIVVYTITARNVGDEPATRVVITDPVPEHMDYTGSVTGEGASITFSIDGGKTYDVANALTIPVGGGEKPAPPEDYTHIRWTFNDALEPGSARSVEFRARLQ